MTRVVALFDLDGTIADNSHRQSYVTNSPKDWDAFFDAQFRDAPNLPIVTLYDAMRSSGMYQVIVVTARPERYRTISEQWFASNGITLDRLIMRSNGDRRKDQDIKREILNALRAEGLHPTIVVDDRTSVVKMWRSEGITCLQCAEHNF